MNLKKFQLKVRHDNGVVNLYVWAVSKSDAKNLVCLAEGCPIGAIIECKQVKE